LTAIAAAADMTVANWYVIESEEIKALPIETPRNVEKALNIDFGLKFDTINQTHA
jgi:hypothetical protein